MAYDPFRFTPPGSNNKKRQDEQNQEGGKIRINVSCRERGAVTITTDRPIDFLRLNALEALALSRVILDKSMSALQGQVESRLVKLDQ